MHPAVLSTETCGRIDPDRASGACCVRSERDSGTGLACCVSNVINPSKKLVIDLASGDVLRRIQLGETQGER